MKMILEEWNKQLESIQNNKITTLNLSYQKLTFKEFEELAKALEKNTSLDKVYLDAAIENPDYKTIEGLGKFLDVLKKSSVSTLTFKGYNEHHPACDFGVYWV